MSRVTVLVAAFNAEKYLDECLDSLAGQTHKDLQILCIDDASTDGTAQILERHAAADSRIKLLANSVNKGQAVSRNMALELADGDYVTMLDADDYLSPDALEKACAALDSDSGMGSVLLRLVYDTDGVLEPYPIRSSAVSWTAQEAFRLSLDWSIHGLYVARRELYGRWPFDESCRLYSDDNTTRMHYLHSARVGRCDGVYYYRQHPESMTNAVSARRIDLLEANMSMARQIRAEQQPREVQAVFERERWINLVGICGFWLSHKDVLPEQSAMDRFRTIWTDIDKTLLSPWLRLKPGYIPCRNFKTFFTEVKIYFALRRLFGR